MIGRAVAKVKIVATAEVVATVKVYSEALQFCVDEAWSRRIRNNVKLHPFVYKQLRQTLPAQLAVACIRQACGVVKRAKSKPIIGKASVSYNFPRSASLKGNVLVLRLLKGRQDSKVKQVKRKFKHLRSVLQAKGTRSAKLLLRKLSGREQRFMAWVNHNISKSIVSGFDGGKIVLEDLKGIRGR